MLKQPKPNGEPAGTDPLDDLNINTDHPLRLKWKLQLTIFRRNSFTSMIHFPLVFVILTEGVLDVVTDFFPVSILHSSFSFLKQKS